MVSNQFFVKKGPFPLKEIIKAINWLPCEFFTRQDDFKIYGVLNP